MKYISLNNSSDEEESSNEEELTGSNEEEEQEEEENAMDIENSVDVDEAESDDDESDNEDDEENDIQQKHESNSRVQKDKGEIIAEEIQNRYEALRGKQMFVRFPGRLPDGEKELLAKVKTLSPLIVKAHKPRQKYARFCLVDFETQKLRDNTLEHLQKAVKIDEQLKGIVISKPRSESEEFVNQLITKRLESLQKKRAKALLRKANKSSMRNKQLTSSIVIINLPKNTADNEVRKLFPNAIDVQLRAKKNKKQEQSVATITLPTHVDARAAIKRKLSINGTQLRIRFNIERSNMKPDHDARTKEINVDSFNDAIAEKKVKNVKLKTETQSKSGVSASHNKVSAPVKRKASGEIQSSDSNDKQKQTKYVKTNASLGNKSKNVKRVKV